MRTDPETSSPIHTHTRARARTHVHACTHARARVRTFPNTHKRTHIHTQMHTHTHTHTNMHTPRSFSTRTDTEELVLSSSFDGGERRKNRTSNEDSFKHVESVAFGDLIFIQGAFVMLRGRVRQVRAWACAFL